MSFLQLEENPLGVIVGHAKRAASSTARWIGRASAAHHASLGTAFLGLGAAIIVGLRAVYGFSWFVALWDTYPLAIVSLIAWVLLAATLAATILSARVAGDRLHDWMFVTFLLGIAGTVALDVYAVWELHDLGRTATAALVAGMALLAVVTFRDKWEVLGAAGVLGLAFTILIFLNIEPGAELDPRWVAAQLTAIALLVLPALIGVVIVEAFRRLVQVELDRVLVQSTVSAPRFAVGMLASEELARLDFAAEELLDSIATGTTPLPLTPKTASVAASLATELRLHLIEGRRETWLYHAVSESEMLGRSVTLIDKSSLAGLLDPTQRDGLLATAWLLLSDTAKANAHRSMTLQVGPLDPTATGVPDRKILVPISITTTGAPRNRVDPSVWDAIERVGKYTDTTQDSSLRIDIECLVDNPADA